MLLAGVSNSGPPVPDRPIRNQAVRNAAVGGGEGLLMLLERLGEQSGHQELKDAKILVWGHSAAASFAITFAALYPKRTIAFVRYHSHLRGLSVDLPAVAQVPGLIFAGENDAAAGVEDAEALWKGGRAANAPWTFAIEPGATHASSAALKRANDLAIPWITAVFRQRLAGDGTTLHVVNEGSGWLANNRTGEITSYGSFSGVTAEASWLPDDASARGWRVVSGFPR
jgi:pimeloyl-ACP methyl ester carboxylesterase